MYDLPSKSLKQWSITGRVTGLKFDAKNEVLIALGRDLVVLDAKTGVTLASVSAEDAAHGQLAITPDNLMICSTSASTDKETYKVPYAWSWSGKQLAPRRDIFSREMGYQDSIHAVATSPNGWYLASQSASTIRIWFTQYRRAVGKKLVVPTEAISDLEFSPDGQRLACAAWDGTVRLWDVDSGRLLALIDADVYRVSSLAFLPDGKLLTANWNGTVHLWDF